MAKYLLTDGFVSVNGVDLSDHAFSLDTPQTKEQVEVSGFSSTGAREFLPGQRDDTATVRFLSDFAASKVHATLQPLFQNGTTFLLKIRPTSGSASATNPEFGGTAALYDYNGLSGELNARGEMEVNFKPASGQGFVWSDSGV